MKTKKLLMIFAIFLLFQQIGFTQTNVVQPIGIGEFIGDFTLKTYNGEEVKTSDLLGKNVLLIFPRGKVTPTIWCPLCFYQYKEIADLEIEKHIRKKYDLEILFVLPYSKDSISIWRKAANNGFNTIENWKNPAGYETLTGGARAWADYVREFFPEKYNYSDNELDVTIPILIDDERILSKGLQLYTYEWGGTKTNQNIPTVYILDKKGIVKFKYHSQYTNDRPTSEYLVEVIKKMF